MHSVLRRHRFRKQVRKSRDDPPRGRKLSGAWKYSQTASAAKRPLRRSESGQSTNSAQALQVSLIPGISGASATNYVGLRIVMNLSSAAMSNRVQCQTIACKRTAPDHRIHCRKLQA
jgi:hypothetical protein